MDENKRLIKKADEEGRLSIGEWTRLFESVSEDDIDYARGLARMRTDKRFGKKIFFRGIIEYSNICRSNCLYCGIRRGNKNAVRYRLTEEDIMECCREGYGFGYRTFVLQGGEDPEWGDIRLAELVKNIRNEYKDCAITLSAGEFSRRSYQMMFDAGADRYLLRHETADRAHYAALHPLPQTFDNRMRCLKDLKDIGFQTGCGIMTGSPYQTPETLAEDMVFMTDFDPEMVGIGPFIPHKDTPFRNCSAGDTYLTLFVIAMTRLVLPDAMIPSTTALGTTCGNGRQLGVLSGCNVVMPNLSPLSVRKKYMLYDNKSGTENDAKSGFDILNSQMDEIGYEVVIGRGDFERGVRR